MTGADRSRRGRRPYLIDLNGAVAGGRLWFDVHHSAAQFELTTIERLASHFAELLRAVVAIASMAEHRGRSRRRRACRPKTWPLCWRELADGEDGAP